MANVDDLFNCFDDNDSEALTLRPIVDESAEKYVFLFSIFLSCALHIYF